MGTNFYFMIASKSIAKKCFEGEYELTDEPYLGYQVHLNKLSCGWRPLFQKHREFDTFKKLEEFYKAHEYSLEIYDEYYEQYTWDEYKKRIFDHLSREPEPMKWYYGIDPIDAKFSSRPVTRLYCDRCKPEEAEFWIPIDHVQYAKTEEEARKKFGIYDYPSYSMEYWNDPDYPIDWVEGEFS